MVVLDGEPLGSHELSGSLAYHGGQLGHRLPPLALVLFHELLLRLVGEVPVDGADRLQHVHVRHTVAVYLVPKTQQVGLVRIQDLGDHHKLGVEHTIRQRSVAVLLAQKHLQQNRHHL